MASLDALSTLSGSRVGCLEGLTLCSAILAFQHQAEPCLKSTAELDTSLNGVIVAS